MGLCAREWGGRQYYQPLVAGTTSEAGGARGWCERRGRAWGEEAGTTGHGTGRGTSHRRKATGRNSSFPVPRAVPRAVLSAVAWRWYMPS
jgi:hypothetical protein